MGDWERRANAHNAQQANAQQQARLVEVQQQAAAQRLVQMNEQRRC